MWNWLENRNLATSPICVDTNGIGKDGGRDSETDFEQTRSFALSDILSFGLMDPGSCGLSLLPHSV